MSTAKPDEKTTPASAGSHGSAKPPRLKCSWCHGKKWSDSALGEIACQRCDASGLGDIDTEALVSEWRKLQDDLELMTAGRQQDQCERLRCLQALDKIASDYEWMKRTDMIKAAGDALCDIGAWRKVQPGEFARHGHVVSPNDKVSHSRE